MSHRGEAAFDAANKLHIVLGSIVSINTCRESGVWNLEEGHGHHHCRNFVPFRCGFRHVFNSEVHHGSPEVELVLSTSRDFDDGFGDWHEGFPRLIPVQRCLRGHRKESIGSHWHEPRRIISVGAMRRT